MTTATTDNRPATRFLVDGQEYGGGPARFRLDRLAITVFTADPDAVARRLPSPLLHPVRWFNGRGVIIIAAGDEEVTIGELPPIRSADIVVAAMVTYRRSRPVPVLPPAGAMVPLVGGVVERRYQVGAWYLGGVATNRVFAEVDRLMFGLSTQIAAIRQDRGSDRLRFTAHGRDGGQILGLEVPAGGRGTRIDQSSIECFSGGSHLFRQPERQTGSQSVRLGGRAVRLRLAEHRLADQMRDIGLSRRALMAVVQHCATVIVDRPPQRLAAAPQTTQRPTPTDPVCAPMVIGHEDGRVEPVEQFPDGLPFDPRGTFEQSNV